MDELMKALTRLANAAAGYYEKMGHPIVVSHDPPEAAPAAPAAPAKNKGGRPRKEPKEEAAPAAPAATGDPLAPQASQAPTAAPAAPAQKEPTEAESKSELDAAAEGYVKKFADQEAGVKAARKIMAEEFKVGKLADMKHDARILFAKRLREEAAKL